MPDAWVRALFAKFAVRYGAKWTSALDSDGIMRMALEEWRRGLAGLTGDDIRRGLDNWDGDWPPSLPEFRKASKPPRQHAAHQPYHALPPPERHIDVADQIAAMREVLRGIKQDRWQEVHGMVRYV